MSIIRCEKNAQDVARALFLWSRPVAQLRFKNTRY